MTGSTILSTSTDATYTSYIVHKKTGYTMATNKGLSIYPFATAITSTNDVIKTSYTFLSERQIVGDADLTTTYTDSSGVASTMRIVNKLVAESTGTLTVDVVFVSLSPITSSPTSSPTADDDVDDADDDNKAASSQDDDEVVVAKSASLAAAVLAGVLLVLLVVLIVLVAGQKAATPSSGNSGTELSTVKNAMA